MSEIRAVVAYAASRFDEDFEPDLVYWEHEAGPAYGDLTCKLAWISDRQESFRDFDSGDETLDLEQSSLVLATIQLTFESIDTTTESYPTARSLSARVRQYLCSRLCRRFAAEKGLAILSTDGPMTDRRKTLDGRLMTFLSFETKWRFEFGLPDFAETQDTIKNVVIHGELDDNLDPAVEVDFTT